MHINYSADMPFSSCMLLKTINTMHINFFYGGVPVPVLAAFVEAIGEPKTGPGQ